MSVVHMVYYPNGDHTQVPANDVSLYLAKGLRVKEINLDKYLGISSKTGKPIYGASERWLTQITHPQPNQGGD